MNVKKIKLLLIVSIGFYPNFMQASDLASISDADIKMAENQNKVELIATIKEGFALLNLGCVDFLEQASIETTIEDHLKALEDEMAGKVNAILKKNVLPCDINSNDGKILDFIESKKIKIIVDDVSAYTSFKKAITNNVLFTLNFLWNYLKNSIQNSRAADENSQNALRQAIILEQHEVVSFFIENKIFDVNDNNNCKLMTPLHIAAMHNNVFATSLFINAGAEIDARTLNKNTPLHTAIFNKSSNVIPLLIAAGANIDAVGAREFSLLQLALNQEYQEGVRLLILAGANTNRMILDIPESMKSCFDDAVNQAELIVTIKEGFALLGIDEATFRCDSNEEKMKFIVTEISKRAKLIFKNRSKTDKDLSDYPILKYVKNRGVKLNFDLCDCGYPFCYEVIESQDKFGLDILCNHFNVSIKYIDHMYSSNNNKFLSTNFLHRAIFINYEKMVLCLLDGGVDVNQTDARGDTPLLVAVKALNVDIIKLLLNRGALIDVFSKDGKTPLQQICMQEYGKGDDCDELRKLIIELLILSGASTNNVYFYNNELKKNFDDAVAKRDKIVEAPLDNDNDISPNHLELAPVNLEDVKIKEVKNIKNIAPKQSWWKKYVPVMSSRNVAIAAGTAIVACCACFYYMYGYRR